MSRLGLFNLAWGFFLLFTAACGGAFVALRSTENFISASGLPEWQGVLQASSHGHTSQFAMIHILLGLTLSYSRASRYENLLKTIGLCFGSVAMGPFLLYRAYLGPTLSTEWNGIVIGVSLSFALVSILAHSLSLFRRLVQRS